jgi:DNA (cytosine-5)-methyltransferase 1
MAELTQLDLCSGVGVGFPLGGIRVGGFKLVGLAEVDEYCSSDILPKRFPGVHNYGDVHELATTGAGPSQRIDFISASPPCQPFSVQGKRQGAEDPRDCFPAVVQIIRKCQPDFFAIENVRGLLTCKYSPGSKGLYFGFLLSEFSRCGYDVEWFIVSGGAVGSPYLRERLLMVGKSRRVVLRWGGVLDGAS